MMQTKLCVFATILILRAYSSCQFNSLSNQNKNNNYKQTKEILEKVDDTKYSVFFVICTCVFMLIVG